MNKKIILSLVAIAVIIPVLGIGMMPDNVDADKIGKEFAANYPGSTIITSPIEEQISEQEEINRAQLIIEGVILEEKPIIADSATSESVSFQQTTVSPEDSIPYSPTSGNEEPSIGVLSAELSNIPLLNEIINVTAVIQNTHYNENAKLVFILRDGWEFVNVPESEIRTLLDNENKTVYHTYGIITVGLGEFQTFTKQVKPTQLGKSIVRVVAPDSNANVGIGLFIGENRTLTTAQYWEENPELNPWNIEREPEVCLNKWCEPEPRPMEEYTGTPDEDTTEYTDDEHFNETRKKQGLPPINNTSVDSVISENVILQGNTVSAKDSIPYSPSSIDANSEPTIPLNRVELSNLPLLHEVVTITVDVRNPSLNSVLEHVVKFLIKDGWEFVNVPESAVQTILDNNNATLRIVTENFTVNNGEIQTFSKQIKPTLLGINYFAVGIPYGPSAQFSLVIGENRTIPTDQYWEENPELAPWNNAD